MQQQITDPAVIADMKRYVKLNQEYKNLQKLLKVFKDYKNLVDNIESGREILEEETDPELREMAREEIEKAEEKIGSILTSIFSLSDNLFASNSIKSFSFIIPIHLS